MQAYRHADKWVDRRQDRQAGRQIDDKQAGNTDRVKILKYFCRQGQACCGDPHVALRAFIIRGGAKCALQGGILKRFLTWLPSPLGLMDKASDF